MNKPVFKIRTPRLIIFKVNPLKADKRQTYNMTTRAISPFNTFLMLTLIIFWGGSFVVVKMALREGLTPIAIATFRFLTAGGLFIVALILKKSRNKDYRLSVEKKDTLKLLLLALTGVTFFFAIQYTGIQLAGASIAAIFVCLLSPIFIAVLSTRILNERLMKKQIFGIGIAAVGAFTVITSGTLNFSGDIKFFLGSLILLSTPVLWATYNLVGKKTLEKYDPFLVVAYVTVLGGLGLIPFSLAESSLQQILTLSLNAWLPILFLSLACSLFGYYIWFYVLKQVGATVTSSFLFIEPVFTVLFAVTFVGETVSLFTLAGGALIFLGVNLITMK